MTETKTTKILDETEENSQDDSKDDRSSNFAANKTKDIVEFNHTTKIENIVTHESALDEMTQKTEPSEGARRARSGRRLHTSQGFHQTWPQAFPQRWHSWLQCSRVAHQRRRCCCCWWFDCWHLHHQQRGRNHVRGAA